VKRIKRLEAVGTVTPPIYGYRGYHVRDATEAQKFAINAERAEAEPRRSLYYRSNGTPFADALIGEHHYGWGPLIGPQRKPRIVNRARKSRYDVWGDKTFSADDTAVLRGVYEEWLTRENYAICQTSSQINVNKRRALYEHFRRQSCRNGAMECGIYAVRSMSWFGSLGGYGFSVYAVVALGGLIVDHGMGYRAEHARIDRLIIGVPSRFEPRAAWLQARRTARLLRKRYGIQPELVRVDNDHPLTDYLQDLPNPLEGLSPTYAEQSAQERTDRHG
jgi:hypothetical protein